ncbi:MAG TPA: ion transporter [Bacteroidia bacterium]|nr:ion transporter [Bacteroidia bacterium]
MKLLPNKDQIFEALIYIRRLFYKEESEEAKLFDRILLWVILASVVVVMLESLKNTPVWFHDTLFVLEWIFTVFFTIEYILRLITANRAFNYARSFYGIVDLLSIIPTYLSLFITGAQSLLILRMLRLMRIFRIFKLIRYVQEARALVEALKASLYKISVFMGFMLALVSIMGACMYIIEGGKNGFDSVPASIYWAIVTVTTVGYGDITPVTVIGKMFSSFIMLIGYSIIAIPTGIVSLELSKTIEPAKKVKTKECLECKSLGHDQDAQYCKHCGYSFDPEEYEKEKEEEKKPSD